MYLDEVIKTESNDFVKIGSNMSSQRNIRLLHATMGVSTEITELFEMVNQKKLDLTNLMEECGDVSWYLGIAIHELQLDSDMLFNTALIMAENKFHKKNILWKLDIVRRKKITNSLHELVKQSGNALDLMKKSVFYSRDLDTNKMIVNLTHVLSDIIFILKIGGFEIEKTFEVNINKLQKKRFKSGKFSSEEANNRNLDEERKALENK